MLNFPDTQDFQRRGRTRTDDKFILLYPGTLNYHQGLDIAVRAFAKIKDQVPQAEFHIYGEGEQFEPLKSLIVELGLQNRVFLRPILPYHQITSVIENSDLGVVPKRSNSLETRRLARKSSSLWRWVYQ